MAKRISINKNLYVSLTGNVGIHEDLEDAVQSTLHSTPREVLNLGNKKDPRKIKENVWKYRDSITKNVLEVIKPYIDIEDYEIGRAHV